MEDWIFIFIGVLVIVLIIFLYFLYRRLLKHSKKEQILEPPEPPSIQKQNFEERIKGIKEKLDYA